MHGLSDKPHRVNTRRRKFPSKSRDRGFRAPHVTSARPGLASIGLGECRRRPRWAELANFVLWKMQSSVYLHRPGGSLICTSIRRRSG